MAQKIRRVIGAEPQRDQEEPAGYGVGFPRGENCVHSIHEEPPGLGTAGGVTWFVAKREDGSIIAKMNAAHVSEVVYFRDGPHLFKGAGDNCGICGRFKDDPATEECRG